MKTATYSGNINNFPLPELERKLNKTSIIVSVILIVFALAMFYLAFFTDNSLVEGSEIFAGIVAVVIAFYMLVWQRNKLIDKETGSVVSKDSIYYNPNDLQRLVMALENDNFSVFKDIKRQQEGNAQIVFFFSEDHKYIAVQVFKYEPFDFKPQTDILVYRDVNAMQLIDSLK